MNGCMICGGFGGHHDPLAHDWVPELIEEPTGAGCYACNGSGIVEDHDGDRPYLGCHEAPE